MKKITSRTHLGTIDAIVMDKKLSYEIVVVNDGSGDQTLIKAKALCWEKRSCASY